jgi:hypothetical protein
MSHSVRFQCGGIASRNLSMRKFLNRAALIIFAVLAVAVFIAAVIPSEAKADAIMVGWSPGYADQTLADIHTVYSQPSFNEFTLKNQNLGNSTAC